MANHNATIDPNLQQRCHDHIKALEVPGINGYDKVVNWVPYNKLKEYWERNRLEEVLALLSPVIPAKTIRAKYLRVFTILVLLDKIGYLPRFLSHALTDECWPRVKRFEGWAEAVEENDFFEDFKRKQWTFFPLEISRHELVDRIVPLERILPFTKVDSIQVLAQVISGGGGGARCSIVTIHESCNQLQNGSGPRSGPLLLKTYEIQIPSWDQEKAYERENEAYSLIESAGSSDNVVKFFGSFRQSGKKHSFGNLLLEYVDGGTLLEYLQQDRSPQTPTDIYDLWSSVSGVLRGLQKVHQVAESSLQSSRRGIIHQDIKLDNILVSKSDTSLFNFEPKLVDFGHSSTATTEGDGRLRGEDTGGNARNAPPENARHFGSLRSGRSTVTSDSDTWAMGCVLFDIAAWVAEGYSNISTFSMMRTEEQMQNSRFKGSEYVQSYHDGGRPLKSVQDYYNLILGQLQVNKHADQITPEILHVVKEHMLAIEPGGRLGPKQVEAMIDRILDKYKPEPGEDIVKSAVSSPTSRSHTVQESSSTIQHRQRLTVDHCITYHKAVKAGGSVDVWVRSKIENLVKSLEGRDHIFLIDNSPSMGNYREDVSRVLEGLSYVAKQLDRNGLELAFISSPRKIERRTRVRDLLKSIDEQHYQHTRDVTEHRFGEFLEEAVVSKLRDSEAMTSRLRASLPRSLQSRKAPLTIFVFTDGCWGTVHDRGAAGIERPIKKLMDKMDRLGVDRTMVTIQFLRFGHDLIGKGFLEYLDEMGQDNGWYVSFGIITPVSSLANHLRRDIVDTRYIDDDVFDIFMSSINMERDRNNSTWT